MLKDLAPGDVVTVTRIDRLGTVFSKPLTRGSIGTILATIKIENTQRYREDLWLGYLDSNQD